MILDYNHVPIINFVMWTMLAIVAGPPVLLLSVGIFSIALALIAVQDVTTYSFALVCYIFGFFWFEGKQKEIQSS